VKQIYTISVASGVGVMLSHGGGSAGSLEQKKSELAKTPVTAPKKPAQDSKVYNIKTKNVFFQCCAEMNCQTWHVDFQVLILSKTLNLC
jgi:hypothetical protein